MKNKIMDKTGLYAKAFLESIRGISDSELLPAISRLNELLKKKEDNHLYPRVLKKIISALEYEKIATVISAHPLDEESESEVLEKIKKSFPDVLPEDINFYIDEKITGGVSISYRDFFFDGTIREALRKLKGC